MSTELVKKFYRQNAAILKDMGIEWHEPHDIKEWSYYLRGVIYWTSIDPEDGTEPCIRTIYPKDNPTFSTAEEVLAVCQKWDDYSDFIVSLWNSKVFSSGKSNIINFIYYYIIIPDKFLEAAVEWREK